MGEGLTLESGDALLEAGCGHRPACCCFGVLAALLPAREPADLAAVKLWVGRPKDLNLVARLANEGRLDARIVADRLRLLPAPLEALPQISARYRHIFGTNTDL